MASVARQRGNVLRLTSASSRCRRIQLRAKNKSSESGTRNRCSVAIALISGSRLGMSQTRQNVTLKTTAIHAQAARMRAGPQRTTNVTRLLLKSILRMEDFSTAVLKIASAMALLTRLWRILENVFRAPKWRNWQTHWIQSPALARACGFKSRLRHHSPSLLFLGW